MNYESSTARYTTHFIVIALLSLWFPFPAGLLIIDGYLAHLYLSICFIYFTLIFWWWIQISYPEQKVNRMLYNLILIPYFIWQSASLLLIAPLIIYYTLYALCYLILPSALLFLNILLLMTLAAVLLVVFYGLFIAPKKITVNEFSIPYQTPIPENYKIAQLSDIHIGNFISSRFLDKIRSIVNNSDADLIVITGDLLTFGDEFIDDAVAFITSLKAKDGVIFSLGNHEYYVDTTLLISKLQHNGCIVLCEHFHHINKGDKSITIGAISGTINNLAKSSNELRYIIRKNSNQNPDVLLAHDSIVFDECIHQKITLTLSGHTHGGQVALPYLNFNLAAYFNKNNYFSGLYQQKSSTLYVNNGLGMSGMPLRLGISPEIAFFKLIQDESVKK